MSTSRRRLNALRRVSSACARVVLSCALCASLTPSVAFADDSRDGDSAIAASQGYSSPASSSTSSSASGSASDPAAAEPVEAPGDDSSGVSDASVWVDPASDAFHEASNDERSAELSYAAALTDDLSAEEISRLRFEACEAESSRIADLPTSLDPVSPASSVMGLSEGVDGYSGGSGTEADPFVISSAEELSYLSTQVASGSTEYEGVYFLLSADINLSSVSNWVPIGTSSSCQFRGSFNGGGHRIYGLTIVGKDYLGLFGRIAGATVSDLSVEGGIVATGSCIGGVVAYAQQSDISRVTSDVDISGTAVRMGGIVGWADAEVRVVHCGNTADISSAHEPTVASNGVGGVVGYSLGAYGDTSHRIDGCYNTGSISIADYCAGGVVGAAQEPMTFDVAKTSQKISNCYNLGTVQTSATVSVVDEYGFCISDFALGGVLGGEFSTPRAICVENCFNAGDLVAPEADYFFTGGVIGQTETVLTDGALYSNNFTRDVGYRSFGQAFKGGASADSKGIGETLSADAMKQDSFAVMLGSAFFAVSGSYPVLSWQDPARSWETTFTYSYDDDSNRDGSTPSVEVRNASGVIVEPVDASSFSLANGTYSYSVELRGYGKATGSFVVSGRDSEIPVTLVAERFPVSVSVTPADARVVLSRDGFASQESSSEDGVHAFDLTNGSYKLHVEKYGYATTDTTFAIEYAGADLIESLTPVEMSEVSISVSREDGIAFAGGDPNIVVVQESGETGSAGERVLASYGEKTLCASLAPGSYRLQASASGCDTAQASFSVPCDGPVNVALSARSGWDASADTSFYDIDPASANYDIYTPAQLAGLSKLVNKGTSFSGKTVTLRDDVDLAGGKWTPIGEYKNWGGAHPFQGIFKGEGHRISNLSISATETGKGLFGYVCGAVVADVSIAGVIDISQTIGQLGVGSVAARAERSTITSCTTNVRIKGEVGNAGGIVGRAQDSSIVSCVNNSEISGEGQYIGGVVGYGERILVESCTNNASVSSYGISAYPVGGIVGELAGASTVRVCANRGSVSASVGVESGSGVGGVVGQVFTAGSKSVIELSCNSGKISGPVCSAGGIVAGALADAEGSSVLISSCYNTGTIATTDPAKVTTGRTFDRCNAGGVVGVLGKGALLKNCYNAGSIDASWIRESYSGDVGGIAGFCDDAQLSDRSRISNNYTVFGSYAAFGTCKAASRDVSGAGETKSAEEMKQAAFAARLGFDYDVSADIASPFYNGGFPYLVWQNPLASHVVAFDVSLDAEENDDGSGLQVTVFDSEGSAVDPVGSNSFSYSLPNGNYAYKVVKRGYETRSGSFTVSCGSVVLPIELKAVRYSISITTNPADADVALVSSDGSVLEPQLRDEVLGSSVFQVLNGSYTLAVRKYGYESRTQQIQVSYAGIDQAITLCEKTSFTVQAEVVGADGADLGRNGATIVVIDEESHEVVYDSHVAEGSSEAPRTSFEVTLSNGRYRMIAMAAGFIRAVEDILPENESSPVTISLTPSPLWSGEGADTSWFDEGESRFYICNAAELSGLSDLVAAGYDFSGSEVILVGDIDLAGVTWRPIGSQEKSFSGIFDGFGSTVYGLSANAGGASEVGLFGVVSGACVKNLVVNGLFTSEYLPVGSALGGVVGVAKDRSSLQNLGGEVSIFVSDSVDACIGGIVGHVVGSDISGCASTGSLALRGQRVAAGGIAGLVEYDTAEFSISDSYFAGSLAVASTDLSAAVGGIVGRHTGISRIENVYISNEVSLSSDDASRRNASLSTDLAQSDSSALFCGAVAGSLDANRSNIVNNVLYVDTLGIGAFGFNVTGLVLDAAEVDRDQLAASAGALGAAYVANNNESGLPLLGWERQVRSLSLIRQPDKASYEDRENFDSSGTVVEVTFADGDRCVISSGLVYHDSKLLNPAQGTVGISYKGARADIPISVKQVEHAINGVLNLGIACPEVGREALNLIDVGDDRFTASLEWTCAGSAFGGTYALGCFYRAHVTLDARYADGDVWWVFSDTASPVVSGSFELANIVRSKDGRSISFDACFAACSVSSEPANPAATSASHRYYEGDVSAGLYDECLDRYLAIDAGSGVRSVSVRDLELLAITGSLGVQRDFSTFTGSSVERRSYQGIGVYDLLRAEGLSSRAGDATLVSIGYADGEVRRVTLGELRGEGAFFDDAGSVAYRSVPLLAFACDGDPLRDADGIVEGRGPLVLCLGMEDRLSSDNILSDVVSIVVEDVVVDDGLNVSFTVRDQESRPIDDVSISLVDSAGNAVDSDGPLHFAVNAGERYSYTISCEGWSSDQGSFFADEQNLAFDIVLQRIWDGSTLAEPVRDADGAYLIGTPDELMWWNMHASPSDDVRLTSDISIGDGIHFDSSTPKWTPVLGELSDTPYSGTFDGSGYTISGLYIDRENTMKLWVDNITGLLLKEVDRIDAVGLFGYASGATIKNLSVAGKIHVLDRPDGSLASWLHAGGIVGFATSGTQILGCSANVSVVAEVATGTGKCEGVSLDGWPEGCDMRVGGIAGRIGDDSSISDCYSRGMLIGAGTRSVSIGGIAGLINSWSGNSSSIRNCYSTAQEMAYPLQVPDPFKSYVGGIVGDMTNPDDNPSASRVESCFALNRTLYVDDSNKAYGGRVSGADGAGLSGNYALSSMRIVNAQRGGLRALKDGFDISMTRSRTSSPYSSAGWDMEAWMLEQDQLPRLSYQADDDLGDEMTCAFAPRKFDPGSWDGQFYEATPPSSFALDLQVEGHETLALKLYNSGDLMAISSKECDGIHGLSYSSSAYSSSAAGRYVSEYLTVDSLLSDAGITLSSGDSFIIGGAEFNYDIYFANPRYYFPQWDSGSSEGASEVPFVIGMKSYGASSGVSAEDMIAFAAKVDYQWAYVPYFGQSSPDEQTYHLFRKQSTGASVRLSADARAQKVLLDLLDEQCESLSDFLSGLAAGSCAAEVERGCRFANAQHIDAAQKALNDARAILDGAQRDDGSAVVSNGEAAGAYERLLSAGDDVRSSTSIGERQPDCSKLLDLSAIATRLLGETVCSESGSGIDPSSYWAYPEDASALSKVNADALACASDVHVSDSDVAQATSALEDAIDRFRAARAVGCGSEDSGWSSLAGQTRYETMQHIVGQAYAGASCDTAIIASGEGFADALSASCLAGVLDAPVIITKQGSLARASKVELMLLGVRNVIILGGTAAISRQVEIDLASCGISFERLAGATRCDTAGLAAERAAQTSSLNDTCIVACGSTFADALSVAPYAYAAHAPVFLTESDGSLGSSTAQDIIAKGFKRVVVVGGYAAVGEILPSDVGGAAVERLAGATRYDTSVKIAQWAVDEGVLSFQGVVVASGSNFPDALCASALAGRSRSVLLLASQTDVLQPANYISEHRAVFSSGYFLGGTAALSAQVKQTLIAASRGDAA